MTYFSGHSFNSLHGAYRSPTKLALGIQHDAHVIKWKIVQKLKWWRGQ